MYQSSYSEAVIVEVNHDQIYFLAHDPISVETTDRNSKLWARISEYDN